MEVQLDNKPGKLQNKTAFDQILQWKSNCFILEILTDQVLQFEKTSERKGRIFFHWCLSFENGYSPLCWCKPNEKVRSFLLDWVGLKYWIWSSIHNVPVCYTIISTQKLWCQTKCTLRLSKFWILSFWNLERWLPVKKDYDCWKVVS